MKILTKKEFLYLCAPTSMNKWQVKKCVKGSKYPTIKIAILIFLMFFMGLTAAKNEIHTKMNILSFANMSSAVDTLALLVAAKPQQSMFLINLKDDILGISDFSLEYSADFPGGNISDKTPLGATWIEHHILDQGSKWGDWRPASCVYFNKEKWNPRDVTLIQATSLNVSSDGPFNWNIGFELGLLSGYNLKWTKQVQHTRTYKLPGKNYGQVWLIQLIFWQTQQSRSCHKDLGDKLGIQCGEKSVVSQGIFPIQNGHDFQWSLGLQNMNFSTCGGGT